MHELPKGLSKSLRSWRGSVSSNHGRAVPEDLEKGLEVDVGERTTEDSELDDFESHPSTQRPKDYNEHNAQRQAQPNGQAHPAPVIRDAAHMPAEQKSDSLLPPSANHNVSDAIHIVDPDPASDRLAEDLTPLTPPHFYELMGMEQPPARSQPTKALAVKHGFYGTIQGTYRYVNGKYRIFDVAIYVLLALQLLLSAVFIVLGSLPSVDSHIAIAVLGAVSTVIGGVLALSKGQGLPNRLRQERDGLRHVILMANELYWDVGAGRTVLFRDVVKVREAYVRITEIARRNHPDTWNTTNTGVAQGIQMNTNGQTQVGAAAIPKVR